jgi:hypothetical protein
MIDKENWLIRTNPDGLKKGQVYFRDFKGRIFYGPNTDPEDTCKQEFMLNLHEWVGIPDAQTLTHQEIQSFILLRCRSILSECIEEIDNLRHAENNQHDISDEPDGIELDLEFTEHQIKAMKRILYQMIKEHSQTGFDEGREELFMDVVSCFVAFSNARQKLLRGEKAFVPWYQYRID